jgi:hypothetical protein
VLWDGYPLVEFFFLILPITHRIFSYIVYTILFYFCSISFCGDEDVAFLEVGEWSRVFGHLLQVVT